MSHFLGRLVERARGAAPRVEPIVAPRFAPAPVVEVAPDNEAAPPARREAPPPRAIESPNPPIVRQEQPETPRREESTVKSIEPAEETLLVHLERAGQEAEPPDRTRRVESLRRDVLPHVQPAVVSPVVRRTNHHPHSAIPQPSRRPAVAANSLLWPNESTVNERPIVRVTIGRIEVRAAPAPPTPARKPSRPSEPKLTLDAYLKARKAGAR